jgi:hypothetical protein
MERDNWEHNVTWIQFWTHGYLDRSDCINIDALLLYLGMGKEFWLGLGIMISDMSRR